MNKQGKYEPSVTIKPFGKTKDGHLVQLYTLKGAGGIQMDVIDYGGKVVRLYTPDRNGAMEDITTGFNDVAGYENIDKYFGSLIGRYGNRIAHGRFVLDGTAYTLPCNNIVYTLEQGDQMPIYTPQASALVQPYLHITKPLAQSIFALDAKIPPTLQ
jgi:aldose 1-epimerase